MIDELDMETLAGAAGMGAVAGLRSMTAPALVSQAARTGSIELTDGPAAFLGTQLAADIASGLALAELVADKLPQTPNRTSALPLAGRAVCGAVAGAAVCSARKANPAVGAVVGALSALGAAFLGYSLRRTLTKDAKIPDFVVALLEDAATVALAVAVLRSEADARPTKEQPA